MKITVKEVKDGNKKETVEQLLQAGSCGGTTALCEGTPTLKKD